MKLKIHIKMPMQFASIPTFVLLFVVLISLGFEWTQAGVVEQSSAMEIPDNIKGRSVHSFNYFCLFVCFCNRWNWEKIASKFGRTLTRFSFPKLEEIFDIFRILWGKLITCSPDFWLILFSFWLCFQNPFIIISFCLFHSLQLCYPLW